jgi:hypothetical protein
MSDREFERIISFMVNENVIRRLLDSACQSVKANEYEGTHAKDCIQTINLIEFLN